MKLKQRVGDFRVRELLDRGYLSEKGDHRVYRVTKRKLTSVEAARVTGVSRSQLYRYLRAGKLSRTPEGLLDTAELLRAGLLLHVPSVPSSVLSSSRPCCPPSSSRRRGRPQMRPRQQDQRA